MNERLQGFHRRDRSGTFLFSLIVCLSVTFPLAELQAGDVLLLVDVSDSMSSGNDKRPAGDKEGVRWDGVSLIVDLATADDLVGLFTFGADIKGWYEEGGRVFYRMNDKNRRYFKNWLSEKKYGRDNGGTPIMDVLQTAMQRFKDERGGAMRTRPALVMLLTDGYETRRKMDDEYQKDLDAILAFFSSNGVPIHTIGLTDECDEELLTRIAHGTRGSYQYVSSNAELLNAMREVAWAAKRLWVADHAIKPNAQGRIIANGGTVDGILDMGFLFSRLDGDSPRVALAPHAKPNVVWRNVQGENITKQVNVEPQLREHDAYWYYYFGPKENDNGITPFKDLPHAANPQFDLPAKVVHSAIFVKRTANALFELVSPGGQARFRYGEEIPLQVRFHDHSLHTAEDFRVTGRLIFAGKDEATSKLETNLTWDADSHLFQGTWVVDLSSGEFAEGFYDVLVTIRGTGGAFEGLERRLPRRTIYVGGKTLIAWDGGEVVLSKENSFRESITVGLDNVASVAVQYELHPPRLNGELVGKPDAYKLTPSPLKANGGMLKFDLTLDSQEDMPRGKQFDPGYIELSGPHLANSLQIPFSVSLDLIRPELAPAPVPPLVVDDNSRQAETAALQFNAVGAAATTEFQVRLHAPEGFQDEAFALYKEKDDPQQGTVSLQLNPKETFHIAFSPNAGAMQGLHEGSLEVTGAGIETRTFDIEFHVSLPELRLQSDSVSVRVARGEQTTIDVAAGIVGGSGTKDVYVQPVGGSDQHSICRSSEGESISVEIETNTKDNPAKLVPNKGKLIPIKITIPENTPCGTYTCQFTVTGQSLAALPFDLTLQIDDLLIEQEVTDKVDGELKKVLVAADEVSVLAVPDHKVSVKLKAKYALGGAVNLEQLEIHAASPTDDHGHAFKQPVIKTDSTDQTITLEFEVPERAFTDNMYQLDFKLYEFDRKADEDGGKANEDRRPKFSASSRIRLVMDSDTVELKPHNPVILRFPGANGEGSQRQRHKVTTKSPEYLQWSIETQALKRDGSEEDQDEIPADAIQVEYVTNEPIRDDTDGEVEFVVTPGRIRPGLYTGSCKLKTSTLTNEYPDQDIEIEVLVAGREVTPVSIQSLERDGKTYAGRTVNLRFGVMCFDCELGTGQYTIEGPAPRADDPDKQETQIDDVEPGHVVATAPSAASKGMLHEVSIPIKASYPGKYQIKVEWPSVSSNGGGAWSPEETLLSEQLLDALPAVSVDMVHAFTFQVPLVTATAKIEEDRLDNFVMDVRYELQDGTGGNDELFVVDDGNKEEFGDEHMQDGIYSAYYVQPTFLSLGTYTFEIGPDNVLPNTLAPAELNVVYDLTGELYDPSVHPVVSCILDYEMDPSQAWKLTVQRLMVLETSLTSDVAWTAILQMDNEYDPDKHPVFALSKNAGTVRAGQPAVVHLIVGLPAAPPTEGEENEENEETEAESLALTIPDAFYGMKLVLCLDETSDTHGDLRKEVTLPFDIEIRAAKAGIDPVIIVVAVGAVLLIVLLFGLKRFLSREKGPAKDSGYKAPPAGGTGGGGGISLSLDD